MINNLHERALNVVLNDHIRDTTSQKQWIGTIEMFNVWLNFTNSKMNSLRQSWIQCYGQFFLWSRDFKLLCIPTMGTFSDKIKEGSTINLFKSGRKQWICNECLWRLCKVFLSNLRLIWQVAPIMIPLMILIVIAFNKSIYDWSDI